jgi:2-C-methyl-D-erythritol 2,4-cyclodiphosphate synthase
MAVAHATVLLESIDVPETGRTIAAPADVDEVNEVVKSLVIGVRDTSALAGRRRHSIRTI